VLCWRWRDAAACLAIPFDILVLDANTTPQGRGDHR
jgi:hypothetical protein